MGKLVSKWVDLKTGKEFGDLGEDAQRYSEKEEHDVSFVKVVSFEKEQNEEIE